MPLPLLPALGLVAEFIAANGMRMATRRYGPEAVRKAMQEIGKRQAAINKRKVVQEARTAELKSPRSASSIEKQRLRALDKRLEKEQPRARFDEEGDLLPEIPLQFAQGDEVDAGIGSLVEEGRTMSDVDRMIAEQAARKSISPVEKRIQMLQQTAADMGRTISDRDAQLFGMGEISFEEAMDRSISGQTMSDMDRQKAYVMGKRNLTNMDQMAMERNLMQQEQLGFAEGGDVSRETNEIESALSDIENVQPEAQVIQQVMTMVMELVQSGASEEEIVAALRQMGLDDEDIEQVMMMLAEQMQGQQDPIQSELSQMM